jgi:hypothetical protein
MIEKGRPWERPAAGPADLRIAGDDAALAAAVAEHPGARVEYRPSPNADLGRALGVDGSAGDLELPLDGLRVSADATERFGVNMLVAGVAPDRANWFTRSQVFEVRADDRVVHAGPATAVVVANGQFLRGADLVPRGHPGDGRIEVQVYAVRRSARSGVRARLPQGVHLPHPQIVQASGRRIEIVCGPASSPTPVPVELDGVALAPAARLIVSAVPEAFVVLA